MFDTMISLEGWPTMTGTLYQLKASPFSFPCAILNAHIQKWVLQLWQFHHIL